MTSCPFLVAAGLLLSESLGPRHKVEQCPPRRREASQWEKMGRSSPTALPIQHDRGPLCPEPSPKPMMPYLVERRSPPGRGPLRRLPTPPGTPPDWPSQMVVQPVIAGQALH